MIKDKKAWDNWIDKNKDAYGGCCVNVAREVMKLLDDDKHKEFDTTKIIIEASGNVASGGITMNMAGAVAAMICQCHNRGDEFKKKWNKHYGLNKEEKTQEGVINPAIVTINVKERK